MAEAFERVVIITGAASGIGAATARTIAAPDTALMLHTRSNAEALNEVAQACRDDGAAVGTMLGDFLDAGMAENLVAGTVARFTRLDQIVANAGFADKRDFGDLDGAAFRRSLQGMSEAFLTLATAALGELERSNWGRVVALSSFVAHVFEADVPFPASAAAKAGIEALAKSLAARLAASGTTVNCVAPGYTKKDASGHSALGAKAWQRAADKTPMGRIGTPRDVAPVIAFLLGREAAFITGQVIHVDGGLTLR